MCLLFLERKLNYRTIFVYIEFTFVISCNSDFIIKATAWNCWYVNMYFMYRKRFWKYSCRTAQPNNSVSSSLKFSANMYYLNISIYLSCPVFAIKQRSYCERPASLPRQYFAHPYIRRLFSNSIILLRIIFPEMSDILQEKEHFFR